MTLNEIIKLSDNDLNRQVAANAGWLFSKFKTEKCHLPVLIDGQEAYVNFEIRNYIGSHDAVEQVLNSISPPPRYRFINCLARVITGNPETYFVNLTMKEIAEVVEASARDKCRALLLFFRDLDSNHSFRNNQANCICWRNPLNCVVHGTPR